jgi:hypothetical protein
MLQTLVSGVSSVFFCTLQLLYLDVSKVNRVLHMGFAWGEADGVGDVRGGVGDIRDGTGDVRASASPLLVHLLVSPRP